jgi:hypothetical protein
MTFFLQTAEGEQPADTMDADIPTRGEQRKASRRTQRITRDGWMQVDQTRNAVLDDMLAQIGGVDVPLASPTGRPYPSTKQYQIRRDAAFAKVTQARDESASAFADLPGSSDEFERQVTERLRAEYDEQQAIVGASPEGRWMPTVVGQLQADLTDEQTLASLPFGAPGRLGVLATMGIEAVVGAAFEGMAATERSIPMADRLGIERPNVAADMATAGLMSAGLGGALAGGVRFLEYRKSRHAAAGESAPEGVSQIDAATSIDAAQEALETGKPLDTVIASKQSGSGPETPPNLPDAPENWQAIRGGIFAGESGGDYEALFGYSNRAGGPFDSVKLTDMTVDQAIAFSNPNGPYAQWVKGQVGHVATPMGAYQIVGKTLKSAKRGLGLTGNEIMTPALQEKLGQWIYRRQGTAAWEGYRGPRADWTPDRSQTSRGYTGGGQVRAGDDITIDVKYEVVDASFLKRASGDLQPRDRSRGASDAWISDTAARLDPALLMPASTADRGTPIVGPDSVIESGNGRFGAIERAYEQFPDRAAEYRSQIETAGFVVPEGIDRPVLIARRTSALDDAGRRDFVVAAQDSGVARMTPTEIARTSARAMSADRLATFDPALSISDPGNGGFVRSVLSALPRSERNAMFDAAGALNAEGKRRLSGAFFARAWEAPDLIERFAELEDAGELKSLMTALDRSAPDWATLRAEIEAGQVAETFDVSGFVTDAMRMISTAREAAAQGQGVASVLSEMLDDIDLLEGPVPPLTVRLVKQFYPNGRAASADSVTDFLTAYAREARQVGKTGDLLGGTPNDILSRLDARFADLPDDLGRPRGTSVPPLIEPMDIAIDLPDLADLDTAVIRAEMEADDIGRAFLDREITFEDGTRASARDILDDLDQDRALIDAVNRCYLGGSV